MIPLSSPSPPGKGGVSNSDRTVSCTRKGTLVIVLRPTATPSGVAALFCRESGCWYFERKLCSCYHMNGSGLGDLGTTLCLASLPGPEACSLFCLYGLFLEVGLLHPEPVLGICITDSCQGHSMLEWVLLQALIKKQLPPKSTQ